METELFPGASYAEIFSILDSAYTEDTTYQVWFISDHFLTL